MSAISYCQTIYSPGVLLFRRYLAYRKTKHFSGSVARCVPSVHSGSILPLNSSFRLISRRDVDHHLLSLCLRKLFLGTPSRDLDCLFVRMQNIDGLSPRATSETAAYKLMDYELPNIRLLAGWPSHQSLAFFLVPTFAFQSAI